MKNLILRLGLIVGLTGTFVLSDIPIPFPSTCATKVLCSEHRLRLPAWNELYEVTFSNVNNGTLEFNLLNNIGNQLIMKIGGVFNNRFRVTIEEPDLHRYHIQYSLEKEPTINSLKVDSADDISLTASDNEGNKIVVFYHPLNIEFYHDDILETIFEGTRLIMDNTQESQAFTFSVKFNGAKRLVGLHEHPNNVGLMHTTDYKLDPYRLKNLDMAFYGSNVTRSMYGSIPIMYGFGNQTSGLFVHNAAEMWVDINNDEKSAYFMVDGGVLDLFVLLGPSLADTIRQYTDLTGKPHLPQLWALGHHQCRWAYNSTYDVKDIIGKFDEYKFPLDVLWLDIEYTADRKWFTWNTTSFPDPVDLMNWVDAQGHRKLVPISDPHMKLDPEYKVYADCLKNDYFIKNADGTPFVGTCWPGEASWIDFLNPAARDYYASLHSFENFPSTSTLGGFWNDMNEPATFDDINEKSIPFETIQYGNVKHRDVHNMYGMLQVMSTHQGLMTRDEGKLRPFLLSRSYFAGSQRYTAKWNGDSDSTFEYLRVLVPMTISANLAGNVFYGADVPGFFGQPTDELASRWYQTGAWIPFYRAHGDLTTARREPWTFASNTQDYIREAIQTRYKHLPYWYTLFYEHTVTGDPLIRPFFYHYPNDDVALDINDQFLVGADILVANVYFTEATILRVYLPGEKDYWYQVTGDTNKVYQGGQWYNVPVNVSFTPVFYKSGSIITQKPRVNRTTADIKDDPYELHVVLDQNGNAQTRVYIDDFESFEYLNKKKYLYVNVNFDESTQSVNVTSIGKDNNSDGLSFAIESLIIYSNNGDGTYSTKKKEESRDGIPLFNINVLEAPILL